MKSKQPRKQRKNLYNAPLHYRRKWLASHLAEDLIVKYNKRSAPVVRGDTVKVVRGEFKNHVDKVREVYPKKQLIEVEGVVTTKVDGSKVPRPVHPSNVIITKMNFTDTWRREKLERGLSEEAKKEIELEAEKQIEEERLEEERRKEEEARKKEEEEKAAEEVEGAEELPGKEAEEKPVEEEKEEAVEETGATEEKPEAEKEEIEEVKAKEEAEKEEKRDHEKTVQSKDLNSKDIEE